MKAQNSINHTSNSERSLEIFIWIAAILVFIIFLIGSSASASNIKTLEKFNETKNTPSSTQLLSAEKQRVESHYTCTFRNNCS